MIFLINLQSNTKNIVFRPIGRFVIPLRGKKQCFLCYFNKKDQKRGVFHEYLSEL